MTPAVAGVGGARLTNVNLGAPDPSALARFYSRLLAWPVAVEEPGWVVLRDPAGGVGLAFQSEPHQPRPVWPGEPGQPHMMAHLEVRVDDLEEAVRRAVELGAEVSAYQPQDDVRVCLDPVGRPFCLYVEEPSAAATATGS